MIARTDWHRAQKCDGTEEHGRPRVRLGGQRTYLTRAPPHVSAGHLFAVHIFRETEQGLPDHTGSL
jgi:hypothetical protein